MKKWTDCARAQLDGWSCHYYCGSAGTAVEYSNDQWYLLLQKAGLMEQLVREQWETLAEFDPEHTIKLVIDEWDCWHPAGTEVHPGHLFEQTSTLRDAVITAITLDIFNRHCEKVEMANVAQLINNLHSLFIADGPRFVATPNFYVFEM
jgi:alpha-L-arabinofuranosidase